MSTTWLLKQFSQGGTSLGQARRGLASIDVWLLILAVLGLTSVAVALVVPSFSKNYERLSAIDRSEELGISSSRIEVLHELRLAVMHEASQDRSTIEIDSNFDSRLHEVDTIWASTSIAAWQDPYADARRGKYALVCRWSDATAYVTFGGSVGVPSDGTIEKFVEENGLEEVSVTVGAPRVFRMRFSVQ